MDKLIYLRHQKRLYEDFESACKRCGECCGSEDGDPCLNMVKETDGRCYCRTYPNRLGPQKTASGKTFECITIREIAKNGLLRPNCTYKDLPS